MVESSFKNKYMAVFLFLVLLSLARTFNAMIKDESGKIEHPCLVAEFREEVFSFYVVTYDVSFRFS